MDLEARTREFFAAHADLEPARILPFLAPGVHVEYVGALQAVDHSGVERMLEAMHANLAALGMVHMRFHVGSVVARRNVTVAEWTCLVERAGRAPSSHAGVHILSWDRDGRVAHASVYTDPETIRRLAVGSHTAAALPGL
jgi:hypothetical protein